MTRKDLKWFISYRKRKSSNVISLKFLADYLAIVLKCVVILFGRFTSGVHTCKIVRLFAQPFAFRWALAEGNKIPRIIMLLNISETHKRILQSCSPKFCCTEHSARRNFNTPCCSDLSVSQKLIGKRKKGRSLYLRHHRFKKEFFPVQKDLCSQI